MLRIMTVCTGNICRSPIAEVVLRDRLDAAGLGEQVVVDSSGISDEESGRPIDPRAARVLAEHGYPVPDHRARQVQASDLPGRDLLLPMTSVHARALRRLAGRTEGAAEIRLYRSFDPAAPMVAEGEPEHVLDIDDPWYGGYDGFEDCLAQIEAGADGVVAHVRDLIAGEPAIR